MKFVRFFLSDTYNRPETMQLIFCRKNCLRILTTQIFKILFSDVAYPFRNERSWPISNLEYFCQNSRWLPASGVHEFQLLDQYFFNMSSKLHLAFKPLSECACLLMPQPHFLTTSTKSNMVAIHSFCKSYADFAQSDYPPICRKMFSTYLYQPLRLLQYYCQMLLNFPCSYCCQISTDTWGQGTCACTRALFLWV